MDIPRGFYPGRRTLPEAAAFWVLAVLFLMLFFASAAASPLYPVYQAQFRFSAATLTAVFAVYVLVLLVTLLFFGSVSDYLGRLPVIITALVFSAAGCALFLAAHGVGTLYAARALQGIATGLATGPIGAALIDLQPSGSQRAPLVTSAFSTLGLALGALITSALAQYAPAPTHLIWWALLAVFAAGTLAVLAMAEPGSRRPGVLASLRPVIAVPRRARGTFAGAIPCLVATWALGGLYLSLGPSLATAATGSPNLIWGGLVIFLLCGTGAAAAYVLRAVSSRAAMLTGCLLLLAGVAVTFGAIATTASAAFLAGTTIAGAGFGLAFQGAFRMTTALATPAQRAGLVTAVFAVGYLAFSVPALIAGVATTKYGLRSTALVYSASLAALVVAAAGILVFRPGGQPAPASRAVMPPGPCTSPPCPQAMDAADRNLSTTAQARRLALARATERAVQMSGLLSVKWLPSIWQTRLQANVISWIVGRIGREVQRTPCSTVSRGVRLSEADVTAAPACGSARYMSTRDTSGRSHRPGWRDLGYPLLLVNAALVLVTVSEGVLLSIVPSTAAGIGQLLHISPGSLNWINTVQLLSTGVCTPVFSRLGDIRGHRQLLCAAALLTAAGGVLMAVAPVFSLLLAGRALQGPSGAFTPLAIGILRGRADISRLRLGTAAVVTGASAGVAGCSTACPMPRSST